MEQWKTIPSHPNYEASTLGKIRRSISGQGTRQNHVLKPWAAPDRYQVVHLFSNGKRVTRYVHSLICETFHGPRPNGCESAHDDGNCLNNSEANLRWKTPSNNQLDQIRHGTKPVGEAHVRSKLTEIGVITIRARVNAGERHQTIADDYQIARQTVTDIAMGRRWKHLLLAPPMERTA